MSWKWLRWNDTINYRRPSQHVTNPLPWSSWGQSRTSRLVACRACRESVSTLLQGWLHHWSAGCEAFLQQTYSTCTTTTASKFWSYTVSVATRLIVSDQMLTSWASYVLQIQDWRPYINYGLFVLTCTSVCNMCESSGLPLITIEQPITKPRVVDIVQFWKIRFSFRL